MGGSESVTGIGEGAGNGGGLSCTGGIGESGKEPGGSTSSPGGFGDSNVELGGGSMMGVVQINKEAGTV